MADEHLKIGRPNGEGDLANSRIQFQISHRRDVQVAQCQCTVHRMIIIICWLLLFHEVVEQHARAAARSI